MSQCGRAAFTLLEFLVVVVVIAILATLMIPVISSCESERSALQTCAICMSRPTFTCSKMEAGRRFFPAIPALEWRNMQTVGSLPSRHSGTPGKPGFAPTNQDLLHNPDYSKVENARVDYMATAFDDKPTTPHKWPRMPWFAETGDVHGNGNLIVFADGSVSDLKTIVKNASPPPK